MSVYLSRLQLNLLFLLLHELDRDRFAVESSISALGLTVWFLLLISIAQVVRASFALSI